MSIEKVRRWDMARDGAGYRMDEGEDGRYIEYADVEGLVEAIKALLPWAESASYGGPDIEADIDNARNELARWQS